MGYSLTPISFWNIDIPVKEVISASYRERGKCLMNTKNLTELSMFKGCLSKKDDNENHLVFDFWNHKSKQREFIEFIVG